MHLDILDFSQKLLSKCISVEVQRLHQATLVANHLIDPTDFSSMINYHLAQCLEQYFKICQTATITALTTPFCTNYYILCLSKEQDEHLMVGPFLEDPIEENHIYPIVNKLHLNLDHTAQLKFYYQTIPFIDPSSVLEVLYTINEYISKHSDLPPIRVLDLSTLSRQDSIYELFIEDMKRSSTYKALEERYANEDKMLSCITNGDFLLAQSYWKNTFTNAQATAFISNSIRSHKNILFVANTLFRKAAQAGGVHPVYLDELSREWALKIEAATSLHELDRMPLQMIRAYCLMTKNRALAKYSPIVQQALTFIHLNLSSALSVKKIASEVGLSPDYLTRLFKKEVGMNVITYMNTKRIYKSLKLLNATNLSIEEIGDLVGLSNTSYFSTLFKKEIGVSPKQYRDQLKSN